MFDKKSYQMIKKVEQTILQYHLFENTNTILVALSGGADSVCLLSILKQLAPQYSLSLMAAHVNHGLRGEEANEDEEFVRALCKQWQIPLFVKQLDVAAYAKEMHMSIEQAGRKVRYDYFEELCAQNDTMKVATAHHKNDQAETVMMHVLRGAGLAGLAGIPYERKNVIRPLLALSREEVMIYLTENGLEHREDKSNQSMEYQRNRVRLSLMPILKEYNPNVVDTLATNARFLQQDKYFLEEVFETAWRECLVDERADRMVFDRAKIAKFPFALFSRLIISVGKKLGLSLRLSYDKIQSMALYAAGTQMAEKKFDQQLCVRFEKEHVIFFPHSNCEEIAFFYELSLDQKILIKEIDCWISLTSVSQKPGKSLDSILIDAALIQLPLVVRSRQIGDWFCPVGMEGTKTIKKYLTDQKINKYAKNRVPIILSNHEVVWVAGMRQDRRFLPTEGTKSFLKIQIEKG